MDHPKKLCGSQQTETIRLLTEGLTSLGAKWEAEKKRYYSGATLILN